MLCDSIVLRDSLLVFVNVRFCIEMDLSRGNLGNKILAFVSD